MMRGLKSTHSLALLPHALTILETPSAGSMRRRIALLNRMIRGWRAYYRAGVPREQFRELDQWLEQQVRTARRRLWGEEQPGACSLELAAGIALRPRQARLSAPSPPTVEGYAYRIPVEGEDERSRVAVVAPSATLTADAGGCSVVRNGASAPLGPDLRAVVIADGALCHAAALRRLKGAVERLPR
jgi:hypothetical protein